MNITKLETMNRTETSSCTVNNFSTLSFVNPRYFDTEKSYHDRDRQLYCIRIDLSKLGTLTVKQKKSVEHIMQIHSLENLKSMNTTFVFELDDSEGYNPYKEFNICIYSLDDDKIIYRKSEWNLQHHLPIPTENFIDECYDHWKKAYEEIEAFGKIYL